MTVMEPNRDVYVRCTVSMDVNVGDDGKFYHCEILLFNDMLLLTKKHAKQHVALCVPLYLKSLVITTAEVSCLCLINPTLPFAIGCFWASVDHWTCVLTICIWR